MKWKLSMALFILACCGSLFGLWSLSQTLQAQRDKALEEREQAREEWCHLFADDGYGPATDGTWPNTLSSPRERQQWTEWECPARRERYWAQYKALSE